MTPQPIPIVVLAAGESRRLGVVKQLVPFRGRTLLAHAIATAQASRCGPVLVVLGSGIENLQAEVNAAGARVVANPDWASGMSSSVHAALGVIEAEVPDASAVLFTVCDQPLVTAELLGEIAVAHRDGHDLVAASYAGAIGVPALFARRFFGELRELTGDSGARRLLTRYASAVFAVPFPGGELDVDTPADAARLTDVS